MYVTLDILRQGNACKDGYERVLKYFTTILKNKEQRIPIWALLLSGGKADMDWVLESCVVIDDKEFEDFYRKSLSWVVEIVLPAIRVEFLRKDLMKSKQKYKFDNLLNMIKTIKDLGIREIKTEDIDKINVELTELQRNYFLNNDNYKNFINKLQVLFPRTAEEKIVYINYVWDVCEDSKSEVKTIGIGARQRMRQLNKEIGELEEDDDNDHQDELDELRAELRIYERKEEEVEESKLKTKSFKDGRHKIDWNLSVEDRFVSFFDDIAFFRTLPTKHGVVAQHIPYSGIAGKPLFAIEKDSEGNLVRGSLVTDDPRMIHRIDRILSRFGNTILEDKC